MRLADFLPYRIAVLAEQSSQCIAQVYAERFGLTRDEWRVLANLADGTWKRTAQLLEEGALEKMQVSRATQRMERNGLIERKHDAEDRRGWLMRLTPEGVGLYRKMVPIVLAREAFLLEALDEDERRTLDDVLRKLEQRARQLVRQG